MIVKTTRAGSFTLGQFWGSRTHSNSTPKQLELNGPEGCLILLMAGHEHARNGLKTIGVLGVHSTILYNLCGPVPLACTRVLQATKPS